MIAWLMGLIVLFFLWTLCVVAAKREPKSGSRQAGVSPSAHLPISPSAVHMRRRDREKIIRVLNAEGRTEIPGQEAA